MRESEDFVQDYLRYSISFMQKPELVRTAIEGTARFEGIMSGEKNYRKRSIIKIILGIIFFLIGIGELFLEIDSIIILLVTLESMSIATLPYVFGYVLFGFIFLIVGIILLSKSRSLASVKIHIKMEGESYKAGAGKETEKQIDKDKTERVGIISDTRLTMYGTVEGKYGNNEIRLRDMDLDTLAKKVEIELIPKFKLPEIDIS